MKESQDNTSGNLQLDDCFEVLDLQEEISFLDRSLNCCVCFVDIVNSTRITAQIADRQKVRQYYSIFINAISALARNYNSKIIKNAGDAVIFYFPETSDSDNEAAFKRALECLSVMILARDVINAKMHSENLPSVSYRISADYGRVEVASSSSSKGEDLFGSIMNICAKINSMAEPNGIVIGGNLYQILKSFSFTDEYRFIELKGGHSVGFVNNIHSVYRVLCNNNAASEINTNNINQLFTPNEASKIKDVKARQQSSQLLPDKQQQQQHRKQERYSINILLVDDEPDTLITYEYFLSAEGYNVEAFTDPQQALKHLVQLPNPSSYYQLVILDIRMPKLNGLQLFNTIKMFTPNIKIMFCSALDIAEELKSILPDIHEGYVIKKPTEREYFVSKINSALKD
jgi:two-component system, OmpR family, response regulator ChvI